MTIHNLQKDTGTCYDKLHFICSSVVELYAVAPYLVPYGHIMGKNVLHYGMVLHNVACFLSIKLLAHTIQQNNATTRVFINTHDQQDCNVHELSKVHTRAGRAVVEGIDGYMQYTHLFQSLVYTAVYPPFQNIFQLLYFQRV